MTDADSYIAAVRNLIATRAELCRADCPCWEVTESNSEFGLGSRGLVIVRCDECCIELNMIELFDDDVALLPEAQAELARRLMETP